MKHRFGIAVAVTVVTVAVGAVPGIAHAAASSLVTVGSPATPFPQNKQNEPFVAIDPAHPSVVAAGANEEIDIAPCAGSDCPFTAGVGTSGVYFSFNGGGGGGTRTLTVFVRPAANHHARADGCVS